VPQDIIGVATLINKRNKGHFDHHDEETFAAFADFCGLALHSATMYEEQTRLAYRCKVRRANHVVFRNFL